MYQQIENNPKPLGIFGKQCLLTRWWTAGPKRCAMMRKESNAHRLLPTHKESRMKRLSRQPGRKLMTMLLATLMAGLPLASEAKLGGSSNGGRSTSMTTRSATPPATSSPSSRLGNGNSGGMTRPDVMARARSNTPPPAGAYAGGAPMPSAPPAAAPRSGPGWGTVAGAAAVGAAAGYMMGDHNSPQTPAQAPGNASQGNSDSGASRDMQRSASEAGAPVSPEKSSSGGFGFGSLLGLLALGGGGLWAFRKYQASRHPQFASRSEPIGSFKASDAPVFGASAPSANADTAIEQLALKAFNELQEANNRGDLTFLRTRVDDLLFQQLEADITQRGGPGHTTVVSMRPQVLDVTDQGARRLVSIQYTGTIVEGPDAAPEALDEVWHFVDENRGFWKLAGIEQV